MKKIHYLSVLLLFTTLACSEGETDPVPTEFTGIWSGEMRCPPSPLSLNIIMNIREDEATCDNCYTVGLSMDGPEDVVAARVMNGELVLDQYIIDEGGSDAVSFDGRGRLTADGKLIFDFELEEMSGDNFSFTCTTTFTSQ